MLSACQMCMWGVDLSLEVDTVYFTFTIITQVFLVECLYLPCMYSTDNGQICAWVEVHAGQVLNCQNSVLQIEQFSFPVVYPGNITSSSLTSSKRNLSRKHVVVRPSSSLNVVGEP